MRRMRLQVPQKFSVMEVMKLTVPLKPGMAKSLATAEGSVAIGVSE